MFCLHIFVPFIGLRRHLGTKHGMREYMYPSQRGESKTIEARKKLLNDAAVKAIVIDGRSFNDFRRPGMQQFLNLALPGYRGPHRTTSSKKLSHMYVDYVKLAIEELTEILQIAVTADLWRSIR